MAKGYFTPGFEERFPHLAHLKNQRIRENTTQSKISQKGEEKMNIETLKEQHPHLYAEIYADGRKEGERQRRAAVTKAAIEAWESIFTKGKAVGISSDTIMTWFKKGATLPEIKVRLSGIEGGKQSRGRA